MKLPAAIVALLMAGAASLPAQRPGSQQAAGEEAPSAAMPSDEFDQLCVRVGQLMEAGGFAIPALARAAEPIIESVNQSCNQLRRNPGAGEPTYTLLINVRAYLNLADAVPKPFPFPETAAGQIEEVRAAANRLDAHFRGLLNGKDAELRSADRDNVAEFREANRLVPPPAEGGRRVVFLGDSVTSQWRINEYFPEEDFINRSIDGQLTGQLLGRMKADVVNLRPTAVVIQGGSFDLTRNIALTAIEDHYELMANVAEANGIKLLFTSVLPVSDYHMQQNPSYERTPLRPSRYIRALNDWLKAFCAQRGCTYVDFYTALADDQGYLMEDASDDGLLPNAKGYRLMAPLVAEAVAEATRPPAPPAKAARRR